MKFLFLRKKEMNEIIKKIEENKSKYLFFVYDMHDRKKYGLKHIYETAGVLIEKGLDAYIIVNDETYKGKRPEWIGDYVNDIPHLTFEQLSTDEKMKLGPQDFIVIPETFISLVEKIREAKVPSEIIIFAQNWDHKFRYLEVGSRWDYSYGIRNVICNSVYHKNYLQSIYGDSISISVIEPYVPEYAFYDKQTKKPYIAIYSRFLDEGQDFIKAFYAKYPALSWVPFLTLNGLDHKDYMVELHKCFLSVWLDKPSSFGTFPIESMASKNWVVGLLPDLTHDWMLSEKGLRNNGWWLFSKIEVVDKVAALIVDFLESNDHLDVIKEGLETAHFYNQERFIEQVSSAFKFIKKDRIQKIKTIIEKNEK